MESKLKMTKKLELLSEIGEYKLFKYKPTLLHMFSKLYPEPITLRRVLRFGMALKCGYEIFYLVDKDKTVAYCTVQSGKSKRFDYSSEKDIIIGPYVVVEKYRGQNIASTLVDKLLKIKKGTYNYAYAYIKKENIASIKTCEKVGFEYYSNAVVTSLICNVKKSNDSNCKHIIMRYEEKDI